MKIAYLAYWDVSRGDGVVKKMSAQMSAWLEQGHAVKLFAASASETVWGGLDHLQVGTVQSTRQFTHCFQTWPLVSRLLAWKPELVYLRFHMCYPGLARMMRRVPTVLEMNTDDVKERRLSQPWYECVYHQATRGYVLRRAGGIVSVTREIARTIERFGRPAAVVSNAIDLSVYSPLPAAGDQTPRLAFIGSQANIPWHGVDKVLWLSQRMPHWRFDLIGTRPGDLPVRVPSNVTAHGFLDRARYEAVLRKADVGIGSLAIHRNGMQEACVLKTREYLAYGIPTIIGYRDTDFPDGAPFLLQLPGGEDNVESNVGRIEAFIEQWKGRRLPREQILHLDVRVKERQRLAFFEQVLANRSRQTWSGKNTDADRC